MKTRLFAIIMLMMGVVDSGFAGQTDTKDVKSAFLVNFARFTEWQGNSKRYTNLCIYESSSIYQNVVALDGYKIGNSRKLRVVTNPVNIELCNIIYWDKASIHLRSNFIDSKVMEVTDSNDVFNYGLDILIYSSDKKLRFFVSEATIAQTNFKLSSKLLRLSREPINKSYNTTSVYSYALLKNSARCKYTLFTCEAMRVSL